jgi:hypothetical protein
MFLKQSLANRSGPKVNTFTFIHFYYAYVEGAFQCCGSLYVKSVLDLIMDFFGLSYSSCDSHHEPLNIPEISLMFGEQSSCGCQQLSEIC